MKNKKITTKKGVWLLIMVILLVSFSEVTVNAWVDSPTGVYHNWDGGAVTTQPSETSEGVYTYTCRDPGCGFTKSTIIPRTAVTVELGKSANIISNASVCQSMKLSNASKYKKYLTFDSRTGKIKTKKNYKVKIKKAIPVQVTIDGRTYTTTVKVKIPAPKVKITKKKVKVGGIKGYRYIFKYNIKGASKIKVRMEKGGTSKINKYLNKNISKAKSTKKSYINYSNKTLKKLNNKVTFKIVAYYGKNQSETFVITK